MAIVAFEVKAGLAALDEAQILPNAQLAPEDKLLYAVVFACHVFEVFLRVHPYANGNGHAARLIVWAILCRYGYWPRKWPIEPRLTDPLYTSLLVEYRNGNRMPLEAFIVQCIIG